MKKFITIAALLAAGTAFSNAATVITLTDLSESVTGDISYDASTGYLSGSSMFDNSASYKVASTTIILNLTALGISSENTTFSGTTAQIIDYRTSPSASGSAIGIQAAANGLQMTWESSTWSTAASSYINWSTLVDSAYDLNGNLCVTLTLESARSIATNTGTATPTVANSTFVYDANGANYVTNGGSAAYGWSGLTASANYSAIYVNSSYVEAVSVFSGAATAGEIATASSELYAAAIPEPSAFGLLAGVGALALVASRRRRTK